MRTSIHQIHHPPATPQLRKAAWRHSYLRDHIHSHGITSLGMEADVEVPASEANQELLQPSKPAGNNSRRPSAHTSMQGRAGGRTEAELLAWARLQGLPLTCWCYWKPLWSPENRRCSPARPWPRQPGRQRAASPQVPESCCLPRCDCWLRLPARGRARRGRGSDAMYIAARTRARTARKITKNT